MKIISFEKAYTDALDIYEFVRSFIKEWKSIVKDYSDIIILNNISLEFQSEDSNISSLLKRIFDLKSIWTIKYSK